MILTRRATLGGLGATLGVGLVGVRADLAKAVQPDPSVRRDFTLTGQFQQGGWARGRLPGGAISASLDGKPIPVTEKEGAFFIAFDRDAGPRGVLAATYVEGKDLLHPLAIAPGAWQIEAVDAPFHPPAMPDETFAALRKAELAQIDAARAHDTGAQGWRQQFVWPVKGRISGQFGAQRVYRGPSGQPQPGSYHSGVDIATGQSGTPYGAPADGVVVLAAAQPFTLEGNLLMIDHGMGLSSAFLHNSALLVGVGDTVRQGQTIAHIGMTGRATGPHLHWSLRWREARLDPMLLTGPMV